jgi:AcrR family transcriptional regulator
MDGRVSEPARNEPRRRSSLRDQQVDLTRELIMRAFQGLLQKDHPDAITYPHVAEAAGVSLRTVYRYFPTRVDLLQSAAAWLAEFTDGARWDDPRTVYDLAGAVPPMGRVFDEHTNVFRALAGDELQEQRRVAVAAAVAEVSDNLPADEARRAEAVLGCLRAGRTWLVLHDHYGLDGDEIVAALDWAARTLLEDVRRRNEAAG